MKFKIQLLISRNMNFLGFVMYNIQIFSVRLIILSLKTIRSQCQFSTSPMHCDGMIITSDDQLWPLTVF